MTSAHKEAQSGKSTSDKFIMRLCQWVWHPALVAPLFPPSPSAVKHKYPKHSALSSYLTMTGSLRFYACWHLAPQGVAAVCVVWAGHFKGKTWHYPLFTMGMWHWKSVCTAASFLPAHKASTCQRPLKCQLVAGPVCVFVSSGHKVCLGKCWQCRSLLIPSSRANIIQFPRMLQPIPPPFHTQTHT